MPLSRRHRCRPKSCFCRKWARTMLSRCERSDATTDATLQNHQTGRVACLLPFLYIILFSPLSSSAALLHHSHPIPIGALVCSVLLLLLVGLWLEMLIFNTLLFGACAQHQPDDDMMFSLRSETVVQHKNEYISLKARNENCLYIHCASEYSWIICSANLSLFALLFRARCSYDDENIAEII